MSLGTHITLILSLGKSVFFLGLRYAEIADMETVFLLNLRLNLFICGTFTL